MRSPNQARPKSTPKKITFNGTKPSTPMATTRVTPTNKTVAKNTPNGP